jgi:hypothetical protein
MDESITDHEPRKRAKAISLTTNVLVPWHVRFVPAALERVILTFLAFGDLGALLSTCQRDILKTSIFTRTSTSMHANHLEMYCLIHMIDYSDAERNQNT